MESKSKQCKVVMLTTDKQATLFERKGNRGLMKLSKTSVINEDLMQYKHLYIISDEEIKEGDYVIGIHGLFGPYEKGDTLYGTPPKVIATTDTSLNLPKPKQAFIDKYINEYNKGDVINDILVEIEKYDDMTQIDTIFKVNGNNEITIHPVKTLWSADDMYLNMQYYMEYCESNGYITPKDWIETKKHF